MELFSQMSTVSTDARMNKSFFIIVFSLLISSFSAFGSDVPLQVISYNVGLTPRLLGFAVSPCNTLRVQKQVQVIFDGDNEIDISQPFVLGLQEVWTKEAFLTYREEAVAKGFTIVPTSYSDVETNGIVTISNLPLSSERPPQFYPFKEDSFRKNRGVLVTHFQLSPNSTVAVGNTHVIYSTAKELSEIQISQFGEIATISERHLVGPARILLGDFNAGSNLRLGDRDQSYTDALWSGDFGIYRLLENLELYEISNITLPTWDLSNGLVTQLTWVMSRFFGGTYDESTSNLDHIFASPNATVHQAGRVFDKKIEGKCEAMGQQISPLHLSDHFGTRALVTFEKN